MLGMPEVILIMVVALIVFGPRKLPELGKSLGQAMAQFRRASEDFKRTWEQEVELERNHPNASLSNSDYFSNSSESHESYNPYANEHSTGDSTTDVETAKVPEASAEKVADHQTAKSQVVPATTSEKHWI